MTVTHVAAHPIVLNERVIQRCAICGEKLLDSKNSSIPIGPDGETPVFPVWTPGSLVEIKGTRSLDIGSFSDESKQLPESLCINLVE